MLIDVVPPSRRRRKAAEDFFATSPLQRSFQGKIDEIHGTVGKIKAEMQSTPGSAYARFAEDIESASSHLAKIIESVDQPQESDRDMFDAVQLVSEVNRLIEPVTQKRGVSVRVKDAGRGPARALGSVTRARQALLNVLTNALKFTPEGAEIQLEVERHPGLRVVVSDSGPGIAPEDRERVFQRFEQLGGQGSGMGLGLAISRDYLRAMGGDLFASDGRCGGATFILEFAPA